MISYAWDDLAQEKPSCPKCSETMEYWYARKRGVIIFYHTYIPFTSYKFYLNEIIIIISNIH